MKKTIVALVLASCVAAIAYASMSRQQENKQAIEKKQPKEKKECKHTCMFG